MGIGALKSIVSDLGRVMIFLASFPMVGLAMVPPSDPVDHHGGAGMWTCRIIFGAIVAGVNGAVLLPDLAARFRRIKARLYLWSIIALVIGTPAAYVMRLILIE
jgi:hypothetical protein